MHVHVRVLRCMITALSGLPVFIEHVLLHLSPLRVCCLFLQAKGILKFVEAISEKTLRSTVAMTAARGRGKSAALGLAIAAAVGFG